MRLTEHFSDDFDSAVRDRGAGYFRAGRVRIDHRSFSEQKLIAVAHGSERYRVVLEQDGRRLTVSCTCPYFVIAPCKHLWAALMAAEAEAWPPMDFTSLMLDPRMRHDVHVSRYGEEDAYSDDEDVSPEPDPFVRPAASRSHAVPSARSRAASWRTQLARLRSPVQHGFITSHHAWPETRELLYIVDAAGSHNAGELCLEVMYRDRKKSGGWSRIRSRALPRQLLRDADPDDRRILAFLAGGQELYDFGGYGYDVTGYSAAQLPCRFRLSGAQPELLLPLLCATERCFLRRRPHDPEEEWTQLTWDAGDPWQLRLQMLRDDSNKQYGICGTLLREGAQMALNTPELLLECGFLFAGGKACRYEHQGAYDWIELLRKQGELSVPVQQGPEFALELHRLPVLPPLELPPELRYERVTLPALPRLRVSPHKDKWRQDELLADLSFAYGDVSTKPGDTGAHIVQADVRRVLMRDPAAEEAAHRRLHDLGCRPWSPGYGRHSAALSFSARRLAELVRVLTGEGWHVEAEGKLYRAAGSVQLQVSSGVDWFELHGEVRFGDATASLPELLAALKRGENTVRLGDGSLGMLPQAWLKQYGLLTSLGDAQGDHLRFKRSQAGLLDALLAAQPEASCDATFQRMREKLREFNGIRPLEPPTGFKGELRPYQKDALGWFDFLRRFGFGGCLADDMGLGKTVQVLALLESRRKKRNGPSLAVVPRSLIFNWKQEAARFTPRLRVLDHTGNQRVRGHAHFGDYDLVLTTYGTLRSDAADFKDREFDYLILDEAQAIKNANSVSAKAARLLRGRHRLALSGTPIENHLGELWSLFEFLNPGMLGAASVFQLAGAARNPDEDTRRLLSHALRPFILRRTKDQVARDLPPRVEQTLFCDLDSRQRRLYDQLRDHYRASLLKRVEDKGLARAKIQILEALLRLRQAAIHPGLLDKDREGEASAKLDVLLPRLLEVIEEGHKTLVFSQFTGMLGILRRHLDKEGIVYEYLDGQTRDRQARVERFQTDPDCKLFLISLKAGGTGLNLTAAQYVFLLDPWWNPAVEAQAIDRAHRIGQTQQVFACRLIARDTVEEKVLELQNTKRDLADAIVGANEGLIRNLGREDLERLLS